jgi:hypothetical protein
MKKFKGKVVVLQDGRVVIDGLPVRKGQQVEVTVRITEPQPPTYPLRGLPFRYDHPFLPVDETDWDVLK